MDDFTKAEYISDFLKIPPFILRRENTRSEKSDNELYEAFKQSLTIPTELLDKIYTSNLAKHFFSSVEIQELRSRWQKNVDPLSANDEG
jgi:hypothetical protein